MRELWENSFTFRGKSVKLDNMDRMGMRRGLPQSVGSTCFGGCIIMELDWADGRGITRVWQKGKVSPYDFKSNPSKYDRGFKNNNACGYLCYGHGGKDACDNGWECGGV